MPLKVSNGNNSIALAILMSEGRLNVKYHQRGYPGPQEYFMHGAGLVPRVEEHVWQSATAANLRPPFATEKVSSIARSPAAAPVQSAV